MLQVIQRLTQCLCGALAGLWANPPSSSFVGDEVLKLDYYVVRYRFGLF